MIQSSSRVGVFAAAPFKAELGGRLHFARERRPKLPDGWTRGGWLVNSVSHRQR